MREDAIHKIREPFFNRGCHSAREGAGENHSPKRRESFFDRERTSFNNDGGIALFFKQGTPFINKGGRMPFVEAGTLFVEGGRTLFGKEEHYMLMREEGPRSSTREAGYCSTRE